MSKIVFPAEWYPQSGVQLTWPHAQTDWCDILDDVIPCFVSIAKEIAKRERLIIVCHDIDEVYQQLGRDINFSNIQFRAMKTNDTWARDHAPISVLVDDEPFIYDFTFNGWGMKFPANYDNLITRELFSREVFDVAVTYHSFLHCVFEGGGIESDGKGTLLTTEECLLSANRNDYLLKEELEDFYKNIFGAQRILWLKNGYLAGDDTDSHIDTLARFCSEDTIAYVKCEDIHDEHFEELDLMEKELQDFTTLSGEKYKLIPLPMPEAFFEKDGHRLPATYANFLIINEAVLLPIYNCLADEKAKIQLQKAFPEREIIPIDCSSLIRQHGSLHCVTMQYPKGFLR